MKFRSPGKGMTWNKMLPPIAPPDYFSSYNFFGSAIWGYWVAARNGLTPNSFSSAQSCFCLRKLLKDNDNLNAFINAAQNGLSEL